MAKTKTNSTLDVLSPDTVEVEIGTKTYDQTPLRIDKLSDALQEIVDTVLSGGRENLLDQLAEGNNDRVAPLLLNLLVGIPKSLPRIVALCLDQPKEEKYILEHIKARQALAVVKTFIEQNEVQELMQDFFGLMTDLGIQMTPNQANGQETVEKLKETVEAMKSDQQTDSE